LTQKKSILIIQQYFYPDISAVSQLLVDLLSPLSDEYEITVLCSSVYNSVEKYDELPESINGVKILRIRGIKAGKKSFFHRLAEYSTFYLGALFHVLTHREYSLVVSMTTPPLIGFFAALGNIPHRRPLIQYVEDLYPELLFDMGYISSPWIIRRLAVFSRMAYRHANRVITLGSYMSRKLRWNYGVDDSNIREIPNYASDVEFSPAEESDDFTLLYSGNAGLAHDFSLMEPLFTRLAEIENVSFSFVGGGNNVRAIADYLSDFPEHRKSFQGYVEKARHSQTLSSGNMLIISQRDETVGDILPSKLYSYLAAGRPLLFLGPRKSEIGELIITEGIGVIVETNHDVPSAIETIGAYMSDPRSYSELCRRIRRIFDSRYSHQRAVDQFKSLLSEVL
jgi:colanic acid biosynthesis glycosyl transferase WcaI